MLLLQRAGWISSAALDMSRAAAQGEFDYYSGLFGLYGTPCLAIYCTFIFLYNIMYIHRYSNKREAKRITIYNYMMLSFFLVFSIINDNKFYYIELLMYGMIIFISVHNQENLINQNSSKKNKKTFRIIRRIIVVGILILGMFELLYTQVSAVKDITDLFIKKVYQGFDYNHVRGGGERIGMILYVLNSRYRYFGYGLSRLKIEENTLGFSHFGQGDVGTFLAFGGISYVAVLFFTIYMIYKRTFIQSIIPIFLLCAYFMMAVYTNAFHNTSTLASLALIYLTCWVISHPDFNKV